MRVTQAVYCELLQQKLMFRFDFVSEDQPPLADQPLVGTTDSNAAAASELDHSMPLPLRLAKEISLNDTKSYNHAQETLTIVGRKFRKVMAENISEPTT